MNASSKSFFEQSQRFIQAVTRFYIVLCCVLLFFMVGFIAVEVLARKFLAVSTKGADELSGYTLAIVSVWAFSYALIHKGHIRIELLYTRQSRLGKRIMDLFSLFSLAVFMAVLTFFSCQVLSTSVMRLSRANTPLQTPLWIPQSLWFLGIVFFSLLILLHLFYSLKWFFQKKYSAVESLIGLPDIEEEIKEDSGIEIKSNSIDGKG
jgi:TRAP-type mannitol/chloroaromatic compound transport system permease small subunit